MVTQECFRETSLFRRFYVSRKTFNSIVGGLSSPVNQKSRRSRSTLDRSAGHCYNLIYMPNVSSSLLYFPMQRLNSDAPLHSNGYRNSKIQEFKTNQQASASINPASPIGLCYSSLCLICCLPSCEVEHRTTSQNYPIHSLPYP